MNESKCPQDDRRGLGRVCRPLRVLAATAAVAATTTLGLAQEVRTEKWRLNSWSTVNGEFGSVVAGSGDWLVAGGPSGDRHYEVTPGGEVVTGDVYFTQDLQAADIKDGDAIMANDVNVIVWQDRAPDIGYVTGSTAVAIDGVLAAYSASDLTWILHKVGDWVPDVVPLSEPAPLGSLEMLGVELWRGFPGGPLVSGFVEHRVRVDTSGGPEWVQYDVIESPNPQSGGGFGTDVAADGPWLVVGAPRENVGSPFTILEAGRVYVYEEGSLGIFELVATLTRPAPYGHFGTSVAIDGDVLVVGAPGLVATTEGASLQDAGGAFLYRFDGSAWVLRSDLRVSTPEAGAEVGTSVALVDGAIAVGAPGTTIGGAARAGAVYIYERHLFADGFETGDTDRWSLGQP